MNRKAGTVLQQEDSMVKENTKKQLFYMLIKFNFYYEHKSQWEYWKNELGYKCQGKGKSRRKPIKNEGWRGEMEVLEGKKKKEDRQVRLEWKH